MSFKDKYTTSKLKEEDDKEKDKTEVSDEAYLSAEMIEHLINKLEHIRLSRYLK